MCPTNLDNWLLDQRSREPLIQCGGPTKEYPEGLGTQVDIAKKREFQEILDDDVAAAGLALFIQRFGCVALRFLDEEPFPRRKKHKPDLGHPAFGLPFHVDVNIGTRLKDYLDPSTWSVGVQGLFQDPTLQGRPADTLIGSAKETANKLVEASDPTMSSLPEELVTYLNTAVDPILTPPLILPQPATLVMAWNVHYIKTFMAGLDDELVHIEAINRVIFDGVTSKVRVPWSNPALSRGGVVVLWDKGFRKDEIRKLVHGRDNNGQVLVDHEKVYRFKY